MVRELCQCSDTFRNGLAVDAHSQDATAFFMMHFPSIRPPESLPAAELTYEQHSHMVDTKVVSNAPFIILLDMVAIRHWTLIAAVPGPEVLSEMFVRFFCIFRNLKDAVVKIASTRGRR